MQFTTWAQPFHPSVGSSSASTLFVLEGGILFVSGFRESALFARMITYSMAPAVSVELNPSSLSLSRALIFVATGVILVGDGGVLFT